MNVYNVNMDSQMEHIVEAASSLFRIKKKRTFNHMAMNSMHFNISKKDSLSNLE